MKVFEFAIAVALLASASVALAQSAPIKGMDDKPASAADPRQATHKAVGVVRKVDQKQGTLTIAHEAVKSLNWPAMTMAFKVQDKALLDKLAEGRKVEVELQQRGKEYIITGVK